VFLFLTGRHVLKHVINLTLEVCQELLVELFDSGLGFFFTLGSHQLEVAFFRSDLSWAFNEALVSCPIRCTLELLLQLLVLVHMLFEQLIISVILRFELQVPRVSLL
jgi:hypothetical protein